MLEKNFTYVSQLIQEARRKTFQSVNQELINLYWKVGEYVSQQIDRGNWGDGTVDELSKFILEKHPAMRGFTRRGPYRMKQFYDTYYNNEIVSSLMTQISWTHHINLLSKTTSIEEKEFYIRLTIKERLSVRELCRQIDAAQFERTLITNKKATTILSNLSEKEMGQFKDSYIFEFLQLPSNHSELDLKKAMLKHLKQVFLEMGRDFTLVGEEFRLQVGMKDYAVDLLFYHRELRCLVPVELKIKEFEPDYLGRLNFYLEALDRDIKKDHENPSIGILLCKGKDDEVVEYAMSRNISPAMVADYSTRLFDKELLKRKMHELFEWSASFNDTSI